MLFRQLLNEPLAAASYLVGCVASGEAAVIDPSLPAEQYVLLAADKGLRISAVLETHMHADYVSTGRALASLSGARIYVPRSAGVSFPHIPVDDGWELRLGAVLLRAIHTPGHTPEHTAYLVADLGRAERLWFVLSGDCLFVGDVGRADLVDPPRTGSEYLFQSLRRLMELPDDTELYPAHYGGSACGGKEMSGKPVSTIGFERRFNPFVRADDLAVFCALLDETPRQAVASALFHRNTNRGELPLPEDYGRPSRALAAPALSLNQAIHALDDGAVLVDLRHRLAFAQGHAPGALSVTYSREALVERVAAITGENEQLAFFADPPFLAQYAADLLTKAGHNTVRGYVDATPDDLQRAGLLSDCLRVVSIDELCAEVERGEALIVDVRDPYEREQGTIPGAVLLPFDEVRSHVDELPPDRSLVVVCESGVRAIGIASLLKRNGFSCVSAVAPDGMSEYLKRTAKKQG